MSINGPALSFDDEGSILFDGEKIIVNVPVGHEVLDHLGAEEDIPFPVVYTHPSHQQNQQPSPDVPPSGNPIFDKEKAIEHNERARQEREAARNVQSQSDVQIIPDIPTDLARDVAPDLVSEEPEVREDWHDTTPLTHLQAEYVDHLLAFETDTLAREVLLGLKRDGMPSDACISDFMSQYAEWGWDDISSALALQILETVRNLDSDETFAYADEDYIFVKETQIPSVMDYVNHSRSIREDRPDIMPGYTRSIILGNQTPEVPIHMGSMIGYVLLAFTIYEFAKSAESHGFDISGKLLQSFLNREGRTYDKLPVDDMIDDLPNFRENIINYIGFNLGDHFPSGANVPILEETDDYIVYSYALPWKKVGQGKAPDYNIYDDAVDNTLELNFDTIRKLSIGKPPSEDIPPAEFNWFIALGEFNYYPRVTMIRNKHTGAVEVALIIEVGDYYAWYVNENTGPLDRIMANLAHFGYGMNFHVSGVSSVIIGEFNVNDKMTINEHGYYRLTVDDRKTNE